MAGALLAGAGRASAQQLSPQQQSTARIEQLVSSRQFDTALAQVNAHLKQYPRDAQMRFMRGRILMALGRRQQAIDAFTALTQDFPELPEPYNNLAALYALNGDYDKARAALEMAVRVNPGFAVAYANLGDIYAKLASEAYAKSAKLAPNARVSAKAAQIDRMLASETRQPAAALGTHGASGNASGNASGSAKATQSVAPSASSAPTASPSRTDSTKTPAVTPATAPGATPAERTQP